MKSNVKYQCKENRLMCSNCRVGTKLVKLFELSGTKQTSDDEDGQN
jgi:hypothetical protein